MNNSQQRGKTERSQVRRAELMATGRKLFADTSYDALSMDDIAKQAGVAKGLIYYYFTSKRGYYLAIVEDSVNELVARAGGDTDLPSAERVRRTIDGYLHYAEQHHAAYRTIVTGGVGSDAEVLAIRDAVRAELVATIAEGAWGHRAVPPLARLALVGWLSGVEGTTLDWIGTEGEPDRPDRPALGALLVRQLRATLTVIEEFVPQCPAPPQAEELAGSGPDLGSDQVHP
ncbi:TetR/AcrR family transcriptional regulator [Streptomyces sp. NBC_00536]|uniref:TetR/AcrR family transcriptional regulator n=1 Tax=Streptomyces sp. NBC_00536 TaxID=2975769 RepID=UPI002E811E11|nr:TetR/AcrR family transcriptional regulator [Streptomyces sp. NBC_00536]WUC77967.1 TetR/AcrR family transcriptional regulator [Streptomyces sp. NBC_00536]